MRVTSREDGRNIQFRRQLAGNEWVELYNTTTGALDLGGCYLDDLASGGGTPRASSELWCVDSAPDSSDTAASAHWGATCPRQGSSLPPNRSEHTALNLFPALDSERTQGTNGRKVQ